MTILRWLLVAVALVPVAPPHVAAQPAFTCVASLRDARASLLRRGFRPADDTARWLQLQGLTNGGLLLGVHTVYSPDGDGYRAFEAELTPSRGRTRGWRLSSRRVWGAFHEERLPERTWTRVRAGWQARVHTRTEDRAEVHRFETIVRPALDDCLDHPGQVGAIERCAYRGNQWHCRVW